MNNPLSLHNVINRNRCRDCLRDRFMNETGSMQWRERWKDNALTPVHPVDDRLHRALWGVAVQDGAVSLISRQLHLLFFLLGGGS